MSIPLLPLLVHVLPVGGHVAHVASHVAYYQCNVTLESVKRTSPWLATPHVIKKKKKL